MRGVRGVFAAERARVVGVALVPAFLAAFFAGFFAGVAFLASACFLAGAFAVPRAFFGVPGGGVASGGVTKASYVRRQAL